MCSLLFICVPIWRMSPSKRSSCNVNSSTCHTECDDLLSDAWYHCCNSESTNINNRLCPVQWLLILKLFDLFFFYLLFKSQLKASGVCGIIAKTLLRSLCCLVVIKLPETFRINNAGSSQLWSSLRSQGWNADSIQPALRWTVVG